MGLTKAKKERDLCDIKIMVVCVLMGMSFTRYADMFDADVAKVGGLFWKSVNAIGWNGSLEDMRKHKSKIILELEYLTLLKLSKSK